MLSQAQLEISLGVPFGLAEAALYPLFTSELIELMRDLLPAERHDSVATSIVVRARR